MSSTVPILVSKKAKAEFPTRLLSWYTDYSVDHPWRQDWNKLKSPYHVWLSEIMLQQTTIAAVTPKYKGFIDKFPTVASVAQADMSEIKNAVQGLGYYRRFGLFQKAAQVLSDRRFKWPESYEEWLDLPGVGPYTAAAVSSITLGIPEPVVDGNVERVLSRMFALPGPVNLPGRKKVYLELGRQFITGHPPGDYNQAMMQLGQIVCTPTNPSCSVCPASPFCRAQKQKLQSVIPATKEKKPKINVELLLLCKRSGQKIAVRERSAKSKFLKSELGLPMLIKDPESKLWFLDGKEMFGKKPAGQIIHRYSHSITNHKISASVLECRDPILIPGIKYIPISEVQSKLISSLDLKALKVI